MISEITATTFGDLQRAANSAIKALGQSDAWFRGHEDADWNLRPRIFREFTHAQEIKFFGKFKHRAVGLRKGCPSLDNIGEWLCLMQHQGLPTRLLDWSRSLAVAAFFAVVASRGRGDAIIWVMSPLGLNEKILKIPYLVTLEHTALEQVVKGAQYIKYNSDLAGAVVVPEIDYRMVAQQAAFTIHGSSKPLEECDGAEDFLYRIRIPEHCRGHFSVALRQFGIRLTTIFPDLPALAKELIGEELYGGGLWPPDIGAGFKPEQCLRSTPKS